MVVNKKLVKKFLLSFSLEEISILNALFNTNEDFLYRLYRTFRKEEDGTIFSFSDYKMVAYILAVKDVDEETINFRTSLFIKKAEAFMNGEVHNG